MLELIALVSPFILNSVIGGFKMISRDSMSKTSKRVLLAVFALLGSLSYSELTGSPVNIDSVSSMWQIVVDAATLFLSSHATYSLFFNKK